MALPDEKTFDEVSDKEHFARICEEVGMRTPRQVAVDITSLDSAEAVRALEFDLAYPLVAKPASSADYHYVEFPGKKKIHDIETRAELDELLVALWVAGYGGTFLVQEFVPGDETQMGSLTAYRDRSGTVTLLSTGRVLLEEHTPDMLGVPAAILTEPYPEAMDAAERFLDRADYHGFANFDFKRDPRTGEDVFFEVNPRIGRNNYYVTAAGANVARFLVEDVANQRSLAPVRTAREVLYTVVPLPLLRRYLPPALRSRVWRAVQRRSVVHPLRYRRDGSLKRRATVAAVTLNFFRKYHRYYPKPTSSGT
jgi:D-aspartate ligase